MLSAFSTSLFDDGFYFAVPTSPIPAHELLGAKVPLRMEEEEALGGGNASDFRSFLSTFLSDAQDAYGLPSAIASIVSMDPACEDGTACDVSVACTAVGPGVNCETTMFRVASISKSFTALALMQLVDAKQVRLDQCIGEVLPDGFAFDTPQSFFTGPGGMSRAAVDAEPCIPVQALLTHTAGFDETTVSMIVLDKEDVPPLESYLRRVAPQRVSPLGASVSYSNYAFCLAGLIVEHVSGHTFEQYVRTNILDVIGMNHTSVGARDKAMPDWQDDLAPSSLMVPGAPNATSNALSTYYSPMVPAASIASTGNDMAAYAATHLAYGRAPNGKRVLSEASSRLMQQWHVGAPVGIGFGFYGAMMNNETVVTHDGDLPTFSSRLILSHDQGIGIFASFGKGAVPARDQLSCLFADRYFEQQPLEPLVVPRPTKVTPKSGLPMKQASDWIGRFFNTRSSRARCDSLGALLGNTVVDVTVLSTLDNHTLTLRPSSALAMAVDERVESMTTTQPRFFYDWAPSASAWWQTTPAPTNSSDAHDTSLHCAPSVSTFPYLYQRPRNDSTVIEFATVLSPVFGMERMDGGFESAVFVLFFLIALQGTMILCCTVLGCSCVMRFFCCPYHRPLAHLRGLKYMPLHADEGGVLGGSLNGDDDNLVGSTSGNLQAVDRLAATPEPRSGASLSHLPKTRSARYYLNSLVSERNSHALAMGLLTPLMFICNVVFIMAWLLAGEPMLVLGFPAGVTALLYMPILSVVFSICSLTLAVVACTRRLWQPERRVAFAFICLDSLLLTYVYAKLNLLGMHCWEGQ
jgi:CubicO group peptidase (beta-lactamase class C family)